MAAPQAQPPTTMDEVRAQVTSLLPMIKKHAAENERERKIAPEVIEALRAAGAFRIASPRRHGGLEAGLRSMMELSALIAEADGGTSWVVTLSNVNAWATGIYPKETVDEIYAEGPDRVLGGVIAPSATARRVPGGYRVSGKWPYASASLHADWCAGGVWVEDEDGEVEDQGLVMIPRGELEVEDTWYVAGMRSSGSNTAVAKEVFVPEHRLVSLLPVSSGSYLAEHPDSAFYRSAYGPMLVLVLVGPQLGLGRAALDIAVSKASQKALAYTNIERQSDSVAFQLMVAEAATKIDTAHLHAFRAADDVIRYAEAGVFPEFDARARMRADSAVALRSITGAIDILLDACGASSFAEVNPLQRIWRDSNVGARHAVILPQVSMETYGKALLSRTDHITSII
ncbi:oxidoreductase [Actinokineospora sp. PR83]|uniref:acyl-CoA dehydrogenase family protein n=1 Tax=Actinokineospora sp. PR83 TaxID=2884908 RepID=UPI001F1A49E1|nr:acyl-CoA dehydrogenase family protein [Actinokineospora sp. PR83]MCG8919744.1 oxidoreductase [Actinokineospora sp. PR83]